MGWNDVQDPDKGYIKVGQDLLGVLFRFVGGLDLFSPSLAAGRQRDLRGEGERGRAARRLLGQQEAHRLRRPQEPGRHLLHELPPAGKQIDSK